MGAQADTNELLVWDEGAFPTSLQIRDTTDHFTKAIDCSLMALLVQYDNSHNQSLTLTLQGSQNGTLWTDLGAVSAAATQAAPPAQSLTDPWPKVRVKAKAGTAPASGDLEARYSTRRQVD